MCRLSVLVGAVVFAAVVLVLGVSDGSATGRLRAVTDLGTSVVAASPGNDKLAGATLIGDLPATIHGSASGATQDAGDPDCAKQDHTVWYRFQPSTGGRFVATLSDTLGGEICVLAKVGGGLREVSQIAGYPDLGDPQPAVFNATAGSSYYIMIGLFFLPGRSGAFTLTLKVATAFEPTWPTDVAVGPDGALWFTSSHGRASIGRVTTTGKLTRYTSPKLHRPVAITVGPDGALWFTDLHSIGRITAHGAISIYSDKRLIGPLAITRGGDSSVWFTDYDEELGSGGSIGRISTTGAIRLFKDPRIVAPQGITSGPDGAIWFTDGGSIGRIDKSGRISFFTDRRIAGPQAITAGPDGALWFTMLGQFTNGPPKDVPAAIGRITVGGAVRVYRAPSINEPSGITASPDGALWFTNYLGRSIGRISVSGTIRTYTGLSISEPFNITAGRDGTIWFTDGNGSIGRLSKAGVVSSFPPPASR